jgi:hypothetical protein
VTNPDDIIPIGYLEVQVWASRALIGAGFPGGAVDQAARLVTQSQLIDDQAIAGFVADLPSIGALEHGTPDLASDGVVDAHGLHALAVAPGVLDMACAGQGGVFAVQASAGSWVLPGVALHGARRGHAVVAASVGSGWLAWQDTDGPSIARFDNPRQAAILAGSAPPPSDGYLVARIDQPVFSGLEQARVLDARALGDHLHKVQHEGFPVRRGTWAGVTNWGWKMLVPTSERSKAQAGGDMGEA